VTVCAVVVTHNRRELLERCLGCLAEQTLRADEVLVVDNASTDGTAELVRRSHPGVSLLSLERNVGGAGGFHAGMQAACERGHDWLWLMDDDTLAEPDALQALIEGAARAPDGAPALLVSRALWKDGRLHPMNRPRVRWGSPGDVALAAGTGLVALRSATFVSLLAPRSAVERFGLPPAHFFIWGDDFEWTSRVLRDAPGYLVPESTVLHWTQRPHTAATTADGARFYYHVRNSLFVLRGRSLRPTERLAFLRFWVGTLWRYLRAHGHSREAMAVVARGVRDGLRRGPR
jgi:rhamnopyranosyl-N-acetylglucosaminyl-diphospho-decaprenol beta-1,3/1,4-galactofuranosyltransferase